MAAPLGPAGVTEYFYRDFFTDAVNDPFNGDYTAVLEPYHIPLNANNANVLNPADLRALVANGETQRVPTAFILLEPDNRLHLYLQLARFNARMGMAATPWDGNLYVQKGELFRNHGLTVHFHDEYFNQVQNQIRVPSPAAIDASYAGDPDAIILGPYNQNDADTELIRCRRTCYVPPPYAALFLAGPLTPRQAWERVRGAIVNDGREGACSPLLNYLRAALTRSLDNQPPFLALTAAPTVPAADVLLLEHRRAIIERDFPGLNAALPQLQVNHIAQQLGHLVADNRNARDQARAEKLAERNKLASTLFGDEGIGALLRYCNVAQEANLPIIYQRLANTTKARRLQAVQHAIDEVLQQSAEPEMQFYITAPILQLILDIGYPMTHPDAIASGLQPFRFPEQRPEEALNERNTYEALYSGSAAPSSNDLATIMKSKVGAPLYFLHARHMLRRTETLLRVLLPANHPLTLALSLFTDRFLTFEARLLTLQMRQPKFLLPTIVIRRVSLEISLWFTHQR